MARFERELGMRLADSTPVGTARNKLEIRTKPLGRRAARRDARTRLGALLLSACAVSSSVYQFRRSARARSIEDAAPSRATTRELARTEPSRASVVRTATPIRLPRARLR